MKMKHHIKAVLCILLTAVFVFANPAVTENAFAASKIKISKTKMTCCVGEAQTLKVTGTSKKVTWTSSNKKVVKVSSKGKIKALKPGKATITARVAGKKLKCKVSVYDRIGTYYCLWNVNSDLSPSGKQLSEKEAAEVRYAINLLFDRSYIAKNIVGAGVKPASTCVAKGITEPDGSQFYKHAGPKNAGYYPASSQKASAMKILEKYYTVSDGMVTDFPEIDYIYNVEDDAHREIAEYMQSKLKAVGIKMNVIGYEWNDFLTVLGKGNFTFARYGWVADVNDANNFLESYVAGNADNYCRLGTGKHASSAVYKVKLKGRGKYKNLSGTWKQTYKKLITYIGKEKNAVTRNKLLHKAEDLLMETGCICPLYYYNIISG